ncbi:glycosyltransferase family 4 protein [Vibrio alginolyticus]
MKLLLISNMYPSCSSPSFGVFVDNIYKQILNEGFYIDKVVIDNNKGSAIKKTFRYILFFLKVVFLFPFYNVLYIHFISHSMIPFVLLSYVGIKPRIVSHVHGGDVKLLDGFSRNQFKIKRKIVQRALNISEKIVVPSYSYSKYVQKEYRVSADKILVYPSGGVDLDKFKLLPIEREQKLLGYAGRLIKSKNVDIIIRALVDLPDFHLEVVGDGNQKNALIELTKKLGVEKQVKFLPPMSQSELVLWYNKINTLIYPSDSESLGLVPIEAMACGAQVVLSDIPAFTELVDLSFNVCIVNEKKPERYSKVILEEMDIENQDRKKIIEYNLDIIRKNYSSSVTLKSLKNVLF